MQEETELFFENVVREDRSILEFIDSDYTFVNERLAKHYGIDGVQGRRLPPRDAQGRPARRRADAGEHPDRHLQPDAHLAGEARQVDPGKHPRHAAAAAAARRAAAQGRQASPPKACRCGSAWSSTGPTRRAPPATSAWTRSASASRTSTPSAAGGRRTAKRRSTRPACCPTAQTFKGPAELKAILKGRSQDFAHCLTEKMLTYALGRGLERTRPLHRGRDHPQRRPEQVCVFESGPGYREERPVPDATWKARGVNEQALANLAADRPEGAGGVHRPAVAGSDAAAGRVAAPRPRRRPRCAWRSSTFPTASTWPSGRRRRRGPATP